MDTFISKLADAIICKEKLDYQNIAIILPNKRAQKKLYAEVASQINKPIFLPTVFSIDEFVHSLSLLQISSPAELLVDLYEIYSKTEHFKKKSLQDFLPWGNLFLQDISEIDMQLAEASSIFATLRDIKELESFGQDRELSESQRDYLEFYLSLKDIYKNFTALLLSKNKGYEGLIYRDAAENVKQYCDKVHYQKYIFAGLNVLSPAEIKIVEYLHENKETEFYFDLDAFYFRKESNSHVSDFIEKLKNKLQLPEIHWVGNYYQEVKKDIKIYGLTKQMDQLYMAAELLHQMSSYDLNNTALVFADESLIVPFIHIYDCTDSNITMSYPITDTHAYHLLQDMFSTAQNFRRFKQNDSKNETIYYHKDVLAFVNNPLIISSFLKGNVHKEYVKDIICKNHIFYKLSELRVKFSEFPDFSCDGIALLEVMENFFKDILLKLEKGFDQSVVTVFIDAIQETINVLQRFPEQELLDIKTIEYFLNEQLKGLSIPFRTDSENGLQIMGLLETRVLDFKNIIMISVNEGIIPVGKKDNSLILFDVRCHYGLPTYQQKDFVYAYHFFRLLQRAEKVYLLYNADSSDAVAEKSRFVSQLEFEIHNQNIESSISIENQNVSMPPLKNEGAGIEIPKNADINKKLLGLSYSPTALSSYINCPLQFYLQYIAEIQEQQTINENIEKNIIGSVVHKVLEKLLSDIKRNPTHYLGFLANLRKNIDDVVAATFYEYDEVKGQDLTRGKMYLATEVAKKNILTYCSIVENELKNNVFTVLGTEVSLKYSLNGVQLKGFCDRIDLRNGVVTILDYKTGKVDDRKLQFIDMETLFSDGDQKQLLQLLMYAYLFKKTNKEFTHNEICCGIIGFQEILKKSDKNIIFPKFGTETDVPRNIIDDELLGDFENALSIFLKSILDDSTPFKQTADTSHCNYCNYKILCGKIVNE